jgi:hypothetical protein
MKKYLFTILPILLLAILLPTITHADEVDEQKIKSSLPKMLGANNVGKEFYFTIPPCFEDESGGAANFIKVFITSAVATQVVVEVEGSGYYNTRKTIANDVIEFNITPVQGQAYTKGGRDPNVPEQIYPGKGIHIYADQPLVVYCVVRYVYTSDGFLAIPVSSLGKEYIVAGWNVDAMFRAVWNYKLPNTCGIVAAYDDTRVRFTLGGNVMTKTAGGMLPGQSKEAVLRKGDVWMFSTDADEADLTGSKVVANKPVGLVTGNMCNNIPTGNQWCDYTVEMDIPTFTWGTDYHVPKVPNRKYTPIIRIFAKEPNTSYYKDGKKIGELKFAGGTEGNAFMTMRMVPFQEKPRSIVISGDKPIGVTLYNCGVQEDGYPMPNSDPFVMVMTPLQQYQKEITFCTPGIMGGMSFPENYINFVYETDEYGMLPADVEFANVVSGQFNWVKMQSKFPGMDELFKYDVQGKKFAVKVITLPQDGVYKIRAKKPFAAYSFGYSWCDSYGFPTSAALADLEKPDTNCPVPTYIVHCDGSVNGGVVTDMPDDSKVRSNLAMILMDDFESFNYSFAYQPFIAGETRTTTWKLTVNDPTKDAQATLTFTDRRGNDTTIVVKYFAVKIGITPKAHDYGLRKLGAGKDFFDFEVVNESKTAPALITEIKLKDGNQKFTLDLLGRQLPSWLGPEQTIPFKVWFDPSEMGSFIDSIGVGDTCIFVYQSEVKAKVAEPIINVTDIDFGTRSTIDPPMTKPFSVENIGKSDLTITHYKGPTLPEYKAALPPADGNGKFISPIVLKPGESLNFNVDFKATTVNTFDDQIVFTNDADKIDNVCLITGRSIMPGLRTRDYDWMKVRINRTAFPRGPYQPDIQTVWFYNDGSQDVTITNVNVNAVKGDQTAFKYNVGSFYSLVVPKGDSVFVPVTFQPDAVGEYELHLTFDNDANIPGVEAKLKGIGILPKLETSDYAFGTTIVNDFLDIKTQKVVFKNVNYQWEDTVYIQDLVVAPAGGIETTKLAWGTEGFRYDKANASLPKLLNPGETLEFDAEFVAAKVGAASASLRTISEAEADVTSNWTGAGITQSIGLTSTNTNICVGSTSEIKCTITNTGSGNITVGPLAMNPQRAYLSFKQPNPYNVPVTVKPMETIDVTIVFTPNAVVDEDITLEIPTSILGMADTNIKFHVTSVHYDAKTSTRIVNPNLGRPWPTIGDVVPVAISFKRENGDIAITQTKELDVTVNYVGDFLKVDRNSLQVGAALPGFAIKNQIWDDKAGSFRFTLYHPAGNVINTDGDIAKFTYGTFLPKAFDSTGNKPLDTSRISVDVQATGNLCLAVTGTGTGIKLQPTCVYDLRLVAISGVEYSLSKISPNPVGTDGTEIEFSVGLEAWTEINVYNTLGELVAMPVASVLEPGNYTVTMPVTDLSSGSYLVRMVSGPYSKTQELIINK